MLYKTDTHAFRDVWIDYIYGLQDHICRTLEDVDGKAMFQEDEWKREGGGGGLTKVIAGGDVFEKGGVNTSVVWGQVTDTMRTQLKIDGSKWFAAGLSMVIHPLNPYVPTTHANWRYFELYNEEGFVTDRWFGGGSDLTPYYLFEEDARHFHRTLKNAIDPFGEELYSKYKHWCDEYFVNGHRDNEMRGIGGVFYDHLRPSDTRDKADAAIPVSAKTAIPANPSGTTPADASGADPADPAALAGADRLLSFQKANGDAFLASYIPIVKARKDLPYGPREIEWQEIRRGRYVEFNLVHDRGTLFGLKTKGRTESILMSLPPRARWEYRHEPAAGSPEAQLLDACRHPKEWI